MIQVAGFTIVTYPPNTGTIEEQTDFILTRTKEVYWEQKLLIATVFMNSHNPESLLGVTPHMEFHQAIPALRTIAESVQADTIWIVFEAWSAPIRKEYDAGRYKRGDVKNHPDRRELVEVVRESYLTTDHHSVWAAFIDRAHGRPKLLEWIQPTLSDADIAAAAVSHILVPKPASNS